MSLKLPDKLSSTQQLMAQALRVLAAEAGGSIRIGPKALAELPDGDLEARMESDGSLTVLYKLV